MDQHLPMVLDEANLASYLATRGLLQTGETVVVRELSGGVSNRAFWVEGPRGALVVKQARARLAVKMEWRADVRRVVREAEAMQWLHERLGPPRIPRMVHLDREAKALVMEAVPPPAENYKTRLLAGWVEMDRARDFGLLLAEIHTLTATRETRDQFQDATFFDQLRLSPYLDTTGERHPDLAPRLAELRRECLEQRYCLVHGDYSPKNVLVRPTGLVLLDYEVAHWGNPSFDLGFALTHYLCKSMHLPEQGGAFIDAARFFWRAYQDRVRLTPASRANAGYHLAAIMLARMDGKSPLEYFNDERRKAVVRRLTRTALSVSGTTVDHMIDAIESELP